MDCPQCGSAGFMPETPCKDCGYGMPDDTVSRDKSDADMSMDELNRMLGELGIEPISDVGHWIGEGAVADPVMPAGMHAGRTDLDEMVLPLALEAVTGVEETARPEEIGEMEETALPEEIDEMEETARSEEIGGMEEATLPEEIDGTEEATRPEEIDGTEEAVVLEPTAGKAAASKRKLKDARHTAKPTLAASNLLKALIGWLPALFAGLKADRLKQPAISVLNPGGESVPDPGGESVPDSGGESVPDPDGESVPDPGNEPDLDSDGESARDTTASILSEPVEHDDENPTTEKVSMPRKIMKEKAKPLSAGMKNLIFRITVPVVFILLVVALLQFVLGLRERRMEPDLPSESAEWRYEPWSPEADAPPVPVTVEAADGVFVP